MTDVKQKQEKLIHDIVYEIGKNYDAKDTQYRALIEQFFELMDNKNACNIQALEQIHFGLTQVNNANDELLEVYKNDKKFVRVHKRICERNRRLLLNFKTPIISECDHDIIPVLLKVKTFFDEKMNAGFLSVNSFIPFKAVSEIIGERIDTGCEIASIVTQEYKEQFYHIKEHFEGINVSRLVQIIGWIKLTEIVSII